MEVKSEMQKVIEELDSSLGDDTIKKELAEKLYKIRNLLFEQMKNTEKSPSTLEKE